MHNCPVLAKIEPSPTYQRCVLKSKNYANQQRQNLVRYVNQIAHPLHLNRSGAICLRGSHARGDATPQSDIDLAFVADHPRFRLISPMLSSLGRLANRNISVQSYGTLLDKYQSTSLSFWLSLLHLRYVVGARSLYRRLMKNGMSGLRDANLDHFLKLYAEDLLRTDIAPDPSSVRFGGLTRGFGGIVDYEFASLVLRWHGLSSNQVTQRQQEVYAKIFGCYRYITVYRYLLAIGTSKNFWFASSDVCIEIRMAMHIFLCSLVSLTIEAQSS